jgi:lysophospholipid acyltransferase (LPLAT)-like uncharacterized protein
MSSLAQRWLTSLAPHAGHAYIRLVRGTMRLEYRNREVLDRARREHGAYMLVFWHSRLVMMPYSYPGNSLVVMVSEHRDGKMIAALLRKFGLKIATGSSTRGGSAGLRQLLRFTRAGFDAGITPDGPRGPRRHLKPGAIVAAKLSGLPLVPVTFSARPARRLGSWDRTLLPYPFGRGLFVYGEPIVVPRDAGDEEVQRLRRIVEAEVDRLTDLADEETGIGVEEPAPRVDPG